MIKDIDNTAPGEAFECVLDHDRAYFERNPNARKYVRLPLPGEFDAYPAALEAVSRGWRVRVTPLWQSPDGVTARIKLMTRIKLMVSGSRGRGRGRFRHRGVVLTCLSPFGKKISETLKPLR